MRACMGAIPPCVGHPAGARQARPDVTRRLAGLPAGGRHRPALRSAGGARGPAGPGIALVIGGALIGLLGTLLTGSEPGAVLGILLLAGTAAGALAVRPRAAYLIIPVPAPAYLAAAILAGLVHDRASDTSHTAMAISAVQWIASGFFAMTAATLLAIVVAAVRWAADRRTGRRQRRPLRP